MVRALADPAAVERALEHRYDGHVEAVNRLVDALRDQHALAQVPHVDPVSAGVGARVLVVARAPSWGTDPGHGGTGLVSVEDDGAGAERLLGVLAGAGIDPRLVLPWHAVPSALADDGQPLGTPDVKAGRAALEALVPLLPRLRSVVVHGRDVEPVWAAYAAANASSLVGVRVEPVTFATTDQALAQHRASRLRRVAATYASVAEALR